MKSSSPKVIPLREVRHQGPDDWLHYESLSVRVALHAHTIPMHRHDSVHQFQLIEAGPCTLRLDGQERALHPPCVLQLPPGAVHGFVFGAGCRGRQVTIPSDDLRRTFAESPAVLTTLSQTLVLEQPTLGEAVQSCVRLFDGLSLEFEGRLRARDDALRLLSAQLVIWCFRHGSAEGLAVQRDIARDTLLQRFLALMDRHYADRWTIATYAERLDVSADHLSRVSRTLKGMSALELLHERQYLEARRLLAYTGLRVGDVAQALGFEDSGYFSRFFNRRAGQSPASYRQHHAPGSESKP